MIYDLDKEYFLSQDIEYIIQRINEFYDFEKRDNELIFTSKIELQNDTHFTSDDAHNSFSKLVPRIKSLHNDMYRILESVYNTKNEKKFKWEKLQNKYPLIMEFTYLNNRFKHYKKEYNLTIMITNITFIGGNQKMELQFNFFDNDKFVSSILYRQFVGFFLNYLVDTGMITIN